MITCKLAIQFEPISKLVDSMIKRLNYNSSLYISTFLVHLYIRYDHVKIFVKVCISVLRFGVALFSDLYIV